MSQPLINSVKTAPISSGSNESKLLSGPGAMPIRSNPASQGSNFSMGRRGFYRATPNNGKKSPGYLLAPLYAAQNQGLNQTGKPIQNSYSYSASSYMESKKRAAIGKGTTVSTGSQIAFMQGDRNVVNSAVSKVRGGGAVAPRKRAHFA